MAEEEIIDEIINCSSSANDEEVVHIIQSSDDVEKRQENVCDDKRQENVVCDGKQEPLAGTSSSQKESKGLVFWVPALLMLGREQHRIAVTEDEIQRRISPPECLSQTMLLSLLRLSKEKGKELRQTLAQNNIKKLTSKSAVISCFTKLTESEAAQLAEDYFFLASRNLKLKEINKEIVSSRGGRTQFENQASMTKELLQDILREIETRDTDLNLMTHGFSPLIIRAVIDILIEIITFKGAT